MYGYDNVMFYKIFLKTAYLYPANTFNRVLFPAPDGPKMALKCPAGKVPLKLRRITFDPEIKY